MAERQGPFFAWTRGCCSSPCSPAGPAPRYWRSVARLAPSARGTGRQSRARCARCRRRMGGSSRTTGVRSEEHTSELQSHLNLVCRLLLEKKKNQPNIYTHIHSLTYALYNNTSL